MELDRDAFLEALGHEDYFVRSRMLRWMGENASDDLEVTRRALATIDRLGWEEAFEWPHQLGDLALDEPSVLWLIGQVERSDEKAPDATMKYHLQKWFSGGPLEVIERYVDRLAATAVSRRIGNSIELPEAFSWEAAVRLRMQLARRSPVANQKVLEEVLERCARGSELFTPEIDRLAVVTRLLAEAGGDLDGMVTEWLNVDETMASGIDFWRTAAAIQLAGHLRLTSAAPRLLELFDSEGDWLNQQIVQALVSMGSRDVFTRVVEDYPARSWDVRLYLAAFLERQRFPDTESAVVALLEGEPDDDLRVHLAVAILQHATRSAMKVGRQVFDEAESDSERFEIAETLYAFHRILGEDLPELEGWRLEMDMFSRRSAVPLFEDEWDDPDEGVATPVRRTEPRVGRNEPCPCGSGKKFKKCCLS